MNKKRKKNKNKWAKWATIIVVNALLFTFSGVVFYFLIKYLKLILF